MRERNPVSLMAESIAVFIGAIRNVPVRFDFRKKTPADLDPLCFGAYMYAGDQFTLTEPPRENVKIIFGGKRRALEARERLAALGIEASLHAPYDITWSVHFELRVLDSTP